MKKLISIFLMVISVFLISGCENDFSYFQEKANNVNEYKYYTISQKVSNDKLTLYEKNINVYFKEDLIKVITYIKEINSYDSDKLYNITSNEFYVEGDTLYYNENDEWKTKTSDFDSNVSVNMDKSYFESYSITKKDGRKIFKGLLKKESMKDFLGYNLEGEQNITFNIETNRNNVLTYMSLNYVSSNGNYVSITFKPNYSYVLDFNLPVN